MGTSKPKIASASLPFYTKNKNKRREFNLKQKKAKESIKRDERMRRKREEDKNPELRAARQARNVPMTIERKRVWDEVGGDEEDALGLAVDVERLKRRKQEEEEREKQEAEEKAARGSGDEEAEEDSDVDSMLDSDSEEDSDSDASASDKKSRRKRKQEQQEKPTRAASPPRSTATNLDLTPEALQRKFPALFNPPTAPKILITTSLNSTLHRTGELLTGLFPNSTYIPRSAHRYGHKYSLREISAFATNRGFTSVVVLNEDQKRPSGLEIIVLPSGPHFHFSISNFVEGKKLPGHGNPTEHYPELILNNFRTPLGLLTAHLFRTLYPPVPEVAGRQVVTLHNQRDYIFVRRHRYVFRDRRATEKPVLGTDGKPMSGAEAIRAGLQELGPRFTLKLRRVDRGIQRQSGQEWEWQAGDEKVRTRFAL